MSVWIRVADRLPESGRYVIAFYRNAMGKGRRIRAMYVARFTLEAGSEDDMDACEYNEENDTYYVPGGRWYETNEHEEVNWMVDEGEVTHWAPLPDPPED